MTFRFGSFELDPQRQELIGPDGQIPVQPQVFALLAHLVEHRDRVVGKDELIDAVWDGRIVSDSTLNARINAARSAIGDNGKDQASIKTIARRGFRFVATIDADGDGDTAADALTPAATFNDRPSIAVLPFLNMSGDEDQEYFADGVTEDLITALSKLRGFFVAGRNSSFAYKNGSADARTVGSELGVRYVLEGSVRRAGQRVRITAQLIDAETGGQVWAERYDRDLTDIFALQDEMTENVIGRLAPELYAAEHARLRRKTPASLDAWESFVHGLHFYGQQSREGSEKALEHLKRAIDLDPEYAQALALYAITLAWRVVQRWEPFEQSITRAMEAATRAIAADSNDAWAHMGRGMVSMVARDSEEAVISFNRAVDLSPNFAYAQAMLGAASAYAGRPDEAVACVDKAMRLSPRDTFLDKFHVYYSLAHFQAGRYAEGAEAAEHAAQLKPGHANTYMLAASCHAHHGQLDKAAAALDQFKSLVPGTTAANVEYAIAYRDPKDRARLADGLRKAGLEG